MLRCRRTYGPAHPPSSSCWPDAAAACSAIAIAAGLTSAVWLGAPAAQGTIKTLPGVDSSNYYPFDQIDKSNVARLEMAWFYPYGAPTFSPVFADGMLYGLGRNGSSLVALDAATGKELWVHEGLNGITSKGINYWESADGKDRRLIFAVDSFLQEIDARTGKSIMTFGDNGIVDMRVGLPRAEGTSARAMPASPGRIWRNIMIFGGQSGEATMTPPGDIRAYDVLSGQLLWQFHVIPRPGEFGYETNPPDGYKYLGGANNWGEMSIDEARGIVYLPTGSATADFYGGDRHGQNLFANCLLALDVRTGKRLWHFQTVHHDLWDYDNVSAPQLVTVTHNGKKVDVVAHAGKTGFLYVFDRVTGTPLWPIEERPVEASQVPFEKSWPTQPFPTKPAPFARQSFTEDDVNPWLLTPEEYEALKERVRKAKNGKGPQGGIFVPTVLNGEAISMPGNQGGSNWGTAAADPQRGLVFVTNVNQVALLRLNDVKDPPAAQGRGGGGGGVQIDAGVLNDGRRAYTQYCVACHGADQRGAIPGVPSLVGVTDRMDQESMRVIVSEGRNNMRPIVDASNEEIRAIHSYLTVTNPFGRGGGGGRGRGRGGANAARAAAGSRRRTGRCSASATAGALWRPVLPRRGRDGGQHAVAGRRRGREAADAVSERLQRHGDRDQAAVHDHHCLRPEHRRDQVAGPQRRRSRDGQSFRQGRRPARHRRRRVAQRHGGDQDGAAVPERQGRLGARVRRRDRQGPVEGKDGRPVDRHSDDVPNRTAGSTSCSCRRRPDPVMSVGRKAVAPAARRRRRPVHTATSRSRCRSSDPVGYPGSAPVN